MQHSNGDGCLKALLIGGGLLTVLLLLGWGLLQLFAGSWSPGGGESSGAGVLVTLGFVAVPLLAVWLFLSLLQVTRARRQALREASPEPGAAKTEAPKPGGDVPPWPP